MAGSSDPTRLVLLTQLAAKAASAEFDARLLQVQAGAAIDLRSADKVTGKWDRVKGHQTNDPAPYDCLCYSGDAVVAVAQSKAKPFGVEDLRQLADVMTQKQTGKGHFFTDRSSHEAVDKAGIAELL